MIRTVIHPMLNLNLDQPEASGVLKSPQEEITPVVEVAEEDYNPGSPSHNAEEGNLLNFDLADFFGKEYLSFLDSTEPHQAKHTREPSLALGTDKEYGNPPVLTTAVEQQTQTLYTQLPLKQKLLYVSERVNLKRPSRIEWFNVFVVDNAALPIPKRQKLYVEATENTNPIHLNQPNTPTPSEKSEEELTVEKGGDTESQQPPITLSNVSTSPELNTMDPVRDIHRSDLFGEATFWQQLFG